MGKTLKYLIVTLLLVSCDRDIKKGTEVKTDFIELKSFSDSIIISKLTLGEEELQNIYFINDTTFVTHNFSNKLNVYKKIKTGGVFKHVKTIVLKGIDNDNSFLFCDYKDSCLLVLQSNNVIHKFNKLYEKQDSYFVNLKTSYLKSNYYLTSSNSLPVMEHDNFYLANYTASNANDYIKTYEENNFIIFTLFPDQKLQAKTLSVKPKALRIYDYFNNSACLKDCLLVSLYSGIDSLYIYNLKSNSQDIYPINNRDYSLPHPGHNLDVMKGNNSDATKKYFRSFTYESMFYNNATGHFVLFYTMPIIGNSTKPSMYYDKELRAIVLNKDYKILSYYYLPNIFLYPESFINIKGKGIAMPKRIEDFENEKITYYIFNF